MLGKWLVEESLPDGRYQVVRRNMDLAEAIQLMRDSTSANRLEMWSQVIDENALHAPSAIREGGQLFFDPVLSMLCRVSALEEVQS